MRLVPYGQLARGNRLLTSASRRTAALNGALPPYGKPRSEYHGQKPVGAQDMTPVEQGMEQI